jgi:hypothetical protein
MAPYLARFIHRIAPSEKDVREVDLPDTCFADRRTLGKALREAGLLQSGQRVLSFRTEGNRTVVFPSYSIWHSIILVAT